MYIQIKKQFQIIDDKVHYHCVWSAVNEYRNVAIGGLHNSHSGRRERLACILNESARSIRVFATCPGFHVFQRGAKRRIFQIIYALK